jgi:hypothetical protein
VINTLKSPHRTRLDAMDPEHVFAQRVVVGLGGREPSLQAQVERRLSASRWQAVESARRVRRLNAMTSQASLASVSGPVQLTPWWARLASLLPALVLTLGLIVIDQLNLTQRIEAAAEVDAALLADDLPPAAYVDPGFAEFLKQARP